MIIRQYVRTIRDQWKDAKRSSRKTYHILTSAVRTLPDFVIIGAQKAGTTSLFRYLLRHPNVIPPLKKEVHFFDLEFHRGIGWYRAHFPVAVYKERLAQNHDQAVLTGEGSPLYLFYPHVPQRMLAVLPSTKLIVLLRNPVDRAYSHYQHQVRKGRENRSFEEAIEAEPAMLEKELTLIGRDPSYLAYDYANFSYLARGIYVEQLERWFRFFDRNRFLILESEELFTRTQDSFDSVLEFLGLSDLQLEGIGKHNVGNYSDALDSGLRARLKEYFEPYNERLNSLLGTTYDWD